jgi:uncharacterized radical SAM superfamily Fe-S cluster-containing enzyme
MIETFLVEKTRRLCPHCLKAVEVQWIRKEKAVLLCKICPEPGVNQTLVFNRSNHSAVLKKGYFKMRKETFPRSWYLVLLKKKAESQEPVCASI